MPRVVPSQVVAFLDQVFPWAAKQAQGEHINLHRGHAGQLAALLDLVDKVPDELITVGGAAYSSLVTGAAAIRERLGVWQAQREPPALELVFVGGLPAFSPVRLIRDALAECPDESPTPAASALAFITDAALRENLRNDIGAVERALANGEWKAATVLAGSAIEALLLWKLQDLDSAEISAADAKLVANGTFRKASPAKLEDWVLHEYTEIAVELRIIQPTTAIEIRLARGFRNLIHPGKTIRLGQTCNRGTALSCVAALDHIVRDLS